MDVLFLFFFFSLKFSKVVLLSCNDDGMHSLHKGICTFEHAQGKQESSFLVVVETHKLNTLIILFEFQSNKSKLQWL